MTKDEFQTSLQSWLQENGETLIDIYLHHSGGSGTLYLLKSANQVESVIEFALSTAGQYGDGQATITGFRSGYYPLRGNADESFTEKIQSAWNGKRWYSIVSLENIFPDPLHIIGSGDTQQELESDLVILTTEYKGKFIGFGEHPLDTNDWVVRNGTEVIKITVGTPKWKKPNET